MKHDKLMHLTVFKDIIADANMPKAIERTTVLAEIKKVKVSKTQVKLKTTDMFLQLSVLKKLNCLSPIS